MNEKGYILTEELVKRASRYLAFLKFQKVKGRSSFSISEIVSALGFSKATVADDLHLLGIYHTSASILINSCIDTLEGILVPNRLREAFLICTSEMATRVFKAKELFEQGIRIVAAFDPSANAKSYEIEGIKVLGMDKINSLSDRLHIQLMVIATDKEVAQRAANLAVEAGAKQIINFSGSAIVLPNDVHCSVTSFASSSSALLSLTPKTEYRYAAKG